MNGKRLYSNKALQISSGRITLKLEVPDKFAEFVCLSTLRFLNHFQFCVHIFVSFLYKKWSSTEERFENHLQIVVETKVNCLCGNVTRKEVCQQGQTQRF